MSRAIALAMLAALLVTAAVAYALALPTRVVAQLAAALESGDEGALSSHIDFDAVRDDLKRQLLTSFVAAAPDERVAMAASRFVSPLVESLVTPAALSRLAGSSSALPASDARWSGWSAVVVDVVGAKDEVSQWRFERRRLEFVLVKIALPPSLSDEMERQWAARLGSSAPTVEDEAALTENRARACAAWRKVALGRLQALTLAQRAHHAASDRYANDVTLLGEAPARGPELYDFVVTRADASSFVLEARGKGLMEGDVLQADESGIRVLEDRCAPAP